MNLVYIINITSSKYSTAVDVKCILFMYISLPLNEYKKVSYSIKCTENVPS